MFEALLLISLRPKNYCLLLQIIKCISVVGRVIDLQRIYFA